MSLSRKKEKGIATKLFFSPIASYYRSPLLLFLTMEVLSGVVEEDDTNLAAVVLVDDAGARVDKLLDGQTRARGDARVGPVGRGDGQARGDDGAVAGRDDDVLAAVVGGDGSGEEKRRSKKGVSFFSSFGDFDDV